jgi:hypothetical protein
LLPPSNSHRPLFFLKRVLVLLFSGWPRKCIIDYMDLLLKAG